MSLRNSVKKFGGTNNEPLRYNMHDYSSGDIIAVLDTLGEAAKIVGIIDNLKHKKISDATLSYLRNYKKRVESRGTITKPKHRRFHVSRDFENDEGEIIREGLSVYFTRKYPERKS